MSSYEQHLTASRTRRTQSRRRDRPSGMSHDLLRFEYDPGPDETLYVSGELDVSTAPALKHEVARTLDGQGREFRLDLGGLTFMDSSGAQALLQVHQRLAGIGRQLVVASPSSHVRLALDLLQLDQIIEVRR